MLLIIFLVSLNRDLTQESRCEVVIIIISYSVSSLAFTISYTTCAKKKRKSSRIR